MLFGPPIFSFVFGENWAQSGLIASLLAPWMLLYFAGSPLLSLFFTQRRLNLYFWFNLTLLLLRGAALGLGIFIFKDFLIATALFGLVGFIYWIFIILFTLKLCGVKIGNALKLIVGGLAIPIALLMLKLFIWN
jgi:O-antigen/teichoic acid export membrane protein